MVRVTDVRELVEAAKIDPCLYSFDGERHEALCLVAEGQQWQVFLSERGSRYEEHSFEAEDEACVYFLKRLLRLSLND